MPEPPVTDMRDEPERPDDCSRDQARLRIDPGPGVVRMWRQNWSNMAPCPS